MLLFYVIGGLEFPNLKTFNIKVTSTREIGLRWFLEDILKWRAFEHGKWKLFPDAEGKHRLLRLASDPLPEKQHYPRILQLPNRKSEMEKIFGSSDIEHERNPWDSPDLCTSDSDTDEENGKDFELKRNRKRRAPADNAHRRCGGGKRCKEKTVGSGNQTN